jgi:cytochrome c-type biogenesis protein CcmH
MRHLRVLASLLFMALAAQAWAIQPDEVLDDPALEARARSLSAELRCLVCQNQSIDDSDAPLARDLRILIRERLVMGETDEQVIDFVVARYGEFVLLKPPFAPHTWALWLAAPVLLFLGGLGIIVAQRRRSRLLSEGAPVRLTREEEERIERLLSEEGEARSNGST